MRQNHSVTTTLLVAILGLSLLGLLAAGSAGAAPQVGPIDEDNDSDEGSGPDLELEDRLGDLLIHSSEFVETDRGPVLELRVTWRGETPTTLGVSQLPETGDRATISQTRLIPGEETQLRIDVVSSSDPAVAWTSESLERERAVVLGSTGGTDRGPVPFAWAATLTGLAALGGAGLAFAFTARDRESNAEGQRRDRIA